MRPTTLALIVGCGMLAAGGLAALSAALLRPPVQLSDALDRVAGERPRSGVASPDLGSDRLGAWAYGVLRLPLSATQLQALHLRLTHFVFIAPAQAVAKGSALRFVSVIQAAQGIAHDGSDDIAW